MVASSTHFIIGFPAEFFKDEITTSGSCSVVVSNIILVVAIDVSADVAVDVAVVDDTVTSVVVSTFGAVS